MKYLVWGISILIFITVLVGGLFLYNQPFLKTLKNQFQTQDIKNMSWTNIKETSQKITPLYPWSVIRSMGFEFASVGETIETLLQEKIIIENNTLPKEELNRVIHHIQTLTTSFISLQNQHKRIPQIIIPYQYQELKQNLDNRVQALSPFITVLQTILDIQHEAQKNNERILILLQNTNEPRSTGGFVGSFVIIDFTDTHIEWKLEDMYALDRLIQKESLIPAPEFFHDLSKDISLRDANFFPDFPTSAQQYQKFFESIGEPIPNHIIALNQNIVSDIIAPLKPFIIEEWGIEVSHNNIDLMLQFLLGSSIAGRFNIRAPIALLSKTLWNHIQEPQTLQALIKNINLNAFTQKKHIQLYAQNPELQKKYDTLGISGRLIQNPNADNFLYFDFINIGANKSEKFVWTKIQHDSHIQKNGTVKNKIRLRRTHAIQPNELENLLGYDSWYPTIQSLLTPELRWVLGGGQNRTIIRVFTPKETLFLNGQSPSGVINQTQISGFHVFEIPLFISPNETGEVVLEYETRIQRGSYDFRPYFLQLQGTSGREKTSFFNTISTNEDGRFTAETMNIGRPIDLMDQNFRVLVEYE